MFTHGNAVVSRLFLLCGLALLWLAPRPVMAQCLLCGQPVAGAPTAMPRDAPRPLRIDITAELDFSRVASGGGGGEVSVDPVTGMRRIGGDVADLGGYAMVGEVRVSGEPRRPVRVDLPGTIELVSDSGAVARVTGLTTDLNAAPMLGADGLLMFKFGGRLTVSGASDGNYRGRIPITVEYE